MTPRPETSAAPTYLELVADALLRQPELLASARATLRHWRTLHAQPEARLQAWDELLAAAQRDSAVGNPAGMAELQRVLRSDEPECQRLREFAPLAGLLPREVRRQARDLCSFRH